MFGSINLCWIFYNFFLSSPHCKICLRISIYCILQNKAPDLSLGGLKACVLYVLRVGVTDQMSEPTQRGFLVFLGKQVFYSNPIFLSSFCAFDTLNFLLAYFGQFLQLQSSDSSPSMRVAALRTLAYVLKTLGEVNHFWLLYF